DTRSDRDWSSDVCSSDLFAKLLLENSPSSVRATKALINGFIKTQLDTQVSAAIEDNARIRSTADFREGISSFLEKRKPVWSGKRSEERRVGKEGKVRWRL